MFRMNGNKVQVLKYKISYKDYLNIKGGIVERENCIYAATESEANRIAEITNGDISLLETKEDAWMDGLTVADVPDTYAEAMKIAQLGQAAYEKMCSQPSQEERLSAIEKAIERGLSL